MYTKDDLQQRWWNLEAKLAGRFKKKPDMEAILFLIGIQEFGQIREKFTKEQKQDLTTNAITVTKRDTGLMSAANAKGMRKGNIPMDLPTSPSTL